jgi:hypothetical protein
MKSLVVFFFFFTLLFCTEFLSNCRSQGSYQNFETAVYARSYEVRKMGDLHWLDSVWTVITDQVHIDKIYLETHRDLVMVQEDTLEIVKKYFQDKGLKVAGGITYTVYEPNRFQTFCYTDPVQRQKVQEIAEFTAKHFDEIILDDFFFTNCKCERCIAAKGDQSWTDFRLRLMTDAAVNLVLKPAKKVNPNVMIVIKFPNWYEHFQGLGFNLEAEPSLFDGIYTGTETRDAVLNAQHLQPYHSFIIFRYFENIKPGANRGGWVDTGGSTYLDRYCEQLWLTLLAKAPEITLFDFRQLQRPISQFLTAPWQGQGTSFDLDEMKQTVTSPEIAIVALAAGYTFEKVDPLIGKLGNPVSIKCYKPFHSTGEDFLPSFLGMAGIPVEIVPAFPDSESVILLTESAAADDNIVSKIKTQLIHGNSVVITSGLLKVIEEKGIQDIAELLYTDNKFFASGYMVDRRYIAGEKKILIPEIKYLTNDAWDLVSAIEGPNGFLLVLEAVYAKGKLIVLTIPENYADLYEIPEEVLTRIRMLISGNLPVQLQAPSNVCLFLYDNNTLIVESFIDVPVKIGIMTSPAVSYLEDLQTGVILEDKINTPGSGRNFSNIPEKRVFELDLKPHSFKGFRIFE